MNKLEGINKEISNITEYRKDLATKKQEMDLLLRKANVVKREQKIKEITDKIFEGNDKYKTYQDIKLLQEYMDKNTKLIDVSFQSEMNMDKLAEYGELDINLKSDLFDITIKYSWS